MRVRLKRISGDRPRRRRRLIEQNRNGDIALFSEAFRINIFRLLPVGAAVNDVFDKRV